MRSLKVLTLAAAFVGLVSTPKALLQAVTEAPAGFDNLTNGHTDQATLDANRAIFDKREEIDDGLGPVFDMRGCGECHRNPVIGGISQVTDLRAGHFNGTSFIQHVGGSLIQSQAIDPAIEERVLDGNEVRAFRSSLNTLGDGFVEATANSTFTTIRDAQPAAQRGTIILVPVVEAGGSLRIGRFGHKNQHASLLSSSGDAYLNEMGITNLVNGFNNFATENTSNGNSVARFDQVPDPEDDGDDVEAFAQFMRATKAPSRGPITAAAIAGQATFNSIGCAVCHVPSIVTAAPNTLINGGALRVSAALRNKRYHPFGDFLLHNVGTGDGIVQNGGQGTRNMVRTAPLWGVRTRNRLMHDGLSLTFTDAILRHGGQATTARNNFTSLDSTSRANLIAFLRSL
jgi:CxxC motif-containing protein (DUF1111 family)